MSCMDEQKRWYFLRGQVDYVNPWTWTKASFPTMQRTITVPNGLTTHLHEGLGHSRGGGGIALLHSLRDGAGDTRGLGRSGTRLA